MKTDSPVSRASENWFKRLAYTTVAGLFIILGIVGLVIPVIPGIVFLVLAAVILARVSRRVDGWVKKNPVTRDTQSRMNTIGRLDWGDRLRVAFWYAGAALITLFTAAGRLINRFRSPQPRN
jgi:uncharacterized membrane protein YbaN (DUF454 family)